jgi:choline dehydrogenase-like flavoprotein
VHDSIETADIPARDPAVAEATRRLYKSQHKCPLAEGAAYSFAHLPLAMTESEDEEGQLDNLVENTLQEASPTTTKGRKAQYDILQCMIRDRNEATATVLMTRKQRYTPPSEPAPGNYMTILAMLSYPFSRGSSHIVSANSSVSPEIRFNYLQHPLDAEILSRHMGQIGRMLTLPILSEQLKPGGKTLPSGFPRWPKDLEEIKGYLREFSATNYHPAGTCAMMSEDLDGVVDESLKVYGTANVRVCDASVIPILPRGNILSTVYALAEKGADILKAVLEL